MSTETKDSPYAVISTGGHQHIVSEGDVVFVEKEEGEEGDKITFETVLLTGEGDDVSVGTPEEKATVEGEILEHGRGKKIHGLKFKRKKGYMRRWGHRQDYTKVRITRIDQ